MSSLLAAALGALAALATVTLTYVFNRSLEPYRSEVNLHARQKELIFSKLYDKELESYESLCIALSFFIDSVFALTSPVKQITPETQPAIGFNAVSRTDIQRLNQELAVEVNKTLADFYTKLEARRLYLAKDVYEDAVKIRTHLKLFATEYMIASEYPRTDPIEGLKLFYEFEEKTAEARRLRERLIEGFQNLLRERVEPVKCRTLFEFTRKPPFLKVISTYSEQPPTAP